MVLEGPHALESALRAGAEVSEVYLGEDASASLAELARTSGVRTFVARSGVLEKVLSSTNPQPLAAVARWGPSSVDDLIARAATGPIVLLDGIGDPGNAGTVIRSAAAAGAVGVVLLPGSVDPTNPKVVRATAGTLFQTRIATATSPEALLAALDALRAAGIPVVGAAGGHEHHLDDADLAPPIALAFGNEAHGLGPATRAALTSTVSIPMEPGVESLNVAMAATVLLFESARRRRSE